MSTKKRDDEAFARLRAADPAAELLPDTEALRAAVAARSSSVDELAVRRGRFPRALQVAAAGAGALAIGVGGFALGGGFAGAALASGADSDGGAEVSASRPAPEAGPEGSGAELPNDDAMGAGAAGATGLAPMTGPRAPSGGDGERVASDAAFLPWGGGRTVFTASGLSSSSGSATAYGYDAQSAYEQSRVEELAAAFGIDGPVRAEEGYFMAGDAEGGGANLSVYADGTVSFSFSDPAADLWECKTTGDGECTERDLGEAPQGEDAQAVAEEILVKLGHDPASFEIEVSDARDYEASDYSYVSAFRTVDGKRAGDQLGISLTGGGVQSVWGTLAELVELGDYAVVSPAVAVERLGDPRFGASNQAYPLDWIGPAMAREGGQPAGGVPSLPKPGGSFAWPVENVTIVGASLGLSQHHLGDGSVVLLPTYELTSADGRSWSVIAVADEHLDF